MGEILKAAGCGYENGTSSSITYLSVLSCKFSGILKSAFFLQLSRPQYCWQTSMTSITSMMFTSSVSMNESQWHNSPQRVPKHTTKCLLVKVVLVIIENLLGMILMYNVLILKV